MSIPLGWTGYAIVDRLYVFGGTPYIVSDSIANLNDVQDIVASTCYTTDQSTVVPTCQPKDGELRIVTVDEAQEIFGRFVHKVPGVVVSLFYFYFATQAQRQNDADTDDDLLVLVDGPVFA